MSRVEQLAECADQMAMVSMTATDLSQHQGSSTSLLMERYGVSIPCISLLSPI